MPTIEELVALYVKQHPKAPEAKEQKKESKPKEKKQIYNLYTALYFSLLLLTTIEE